MSDWKVAMICLLPLILGGSRAKLRTWVAMFGASVATIYAPFISAYVVIDLLAASIILRSPAGLSQRMIGLLFVGMIFFELGFILSNQHQQGLFTSALSALGWLQFAILAWWGGYDAFRYCSGRFRPSRSPAVARENI